MKRRNYNNRLLIVYRWPRPTAIVAEWRRRREQCATDLAAAKAAGDFVRYRALRERWKRYFASNPAAL